MTAEKKRLAYDVIAKLLQEYTDRTLEKGEEILTFKVTAHIIDENDNHSRTEFSMGTFDLAEAKFNYMDVMKKYIEEEGHISDDRS